MASKSSDLSPPRSDVLAKTRLQSLLDSPSRVTRSQARRQSNAPKEAPMSPRVTVRRKRTVDAADETSEGLKNESNKSPQGRNSAVAAGNLSSPSRTSQTTRSRKSSFSVKEEASKELPAPGRRVSLRLQSVESTGPVTRRTRGSLKVQDHVEVQQSPVRRTRRSSVSSATSSVTSPSRNNRNRRKLSPVPSLDSSAISGSSSDAKSQPRSTSKSSPLSKKVSPQNDGSSGVRRTSQTFDSTSRLSSGKIVGVVSPSKGTPLKSPSHSRMKSPELVSGTSPSARLHTDDQGQCDDVQSQNLHKRITLSEKSLCLSAPSLLTSTSLNMTVKEFPSVKKKGRLSLQRRSSSPMRNLFVVIPRNLNADYQASSGAQSGSNSPLKSPQVEVQEKNSLKEVKPAVEENINSSEFLEKRSSSSKSSSATEAESSFEEKTQPTSKNSLPESDLEADEVSSSALKKSDKKTPVKKWLRTSSCESDVKMLSKTELNENSPANQSLNASQNSTGRTSQVNVSTGKLTPNTSQDDRENESSMNSDISTESDSEPEVEVKTQNKSPSKRTSLQKLSQTSSSDDSDDDDDYKPPRKTASKEKSPATKSAIASLNQKGKIAQAIVSPSNLTLLYAKSSSDEEHNSSGRVSTSPESPISLQIPDSSSDDESGYVNKDFPEKTSTDKNTSLKTKPNVELLSSSDSEDDETEFRKVTLQKITPGSAAKNCLTVQLDSSDRQYEVKHVSKALIDKATPAKLAFDRTLRSSTPGSASQVKGSQGSFHEGKDSPNIICQSKQTEDATPNSAKRSEGGLFGGEATPYEAFDGKDAPGTSTEGGAAPGSAHAKSAPGSSSESKAPDSAKSTPCSAPQGMLNSRNLLKGKLTPGSASQPKGTPGSASQSKGTPGSASQSKGTPGSASQAKSTPVSSSKDKASDISQSTPCSTSQSRGFQRISIEGEATSGSSSGDETPGGAVSTPTHTNASLAKRSRGSLSDGKATSGSSSQVKHTPSQGRTTPGVAAQAEFSLSAGKTPGSTRSTPDRASQAKYTTDSSSEGEATPDSSFKAKDLPNKSTEGKCTSVGGATLIQNSFVQGTSSVFQGGAGLQDSPIIQRASLSLNPPSRHGSKSKIVTSASPNVEPDTESEDDQSSASSDDDIEEKSESHSNVLDLDTNAQESTGAGLQESSGSDDEEEISKTCLIGTMKPILNKYSPMKTSPSKLFKEANEELIDQSSSESDDESFGLRTISKWNKSNSDNFQEKSDEVDDISGSISSKTKYLKRVDYERKAANESGFPDFDSDEEFSQAADVIISDTDEDTAKVTDAYENLLAELVVEHTDKEPKMSKAEKKALKKAKKAAKMSANSETHNLSTEKSPCLPRRRVEKETIVNRTNISVEPAQGLNEDGGSPAKKNKILKESIEHNSNESHLHGDAQGKNRRKLKKKQKVLGELHAENIPGTVSAELKDDPVDKKSKKRKLQQSQLEGGLHATKEIKRMAVESTERSQKQTELQTEEHEGLPNASNSEETKRKRKKKKKASNLIESEDVISAKSEQSGIKKIKGNPVSVEEKLGMFSSEISKPKAKSKKELRIAGHEGSRTDDFSHMAVCPEKKKKLIKMHGLVDEETEDFEVCAELDKKKKKKKKKTKEMQNVAERETEETEASDKPEKKRKKRKAKEMQDSHEEEREEAEIANLHKKKKKKLKTHGFGALEGDGTAFSAELLKTTKKLKEKHGFVVKEVEVAEIYSSNSAESSKEKKMKRKEKHFKHSKGTEPGGSDSDDAPVSVSFGAARQEALAESRAAFESIKAQKERKKEKSRKLQEMRKQQLLAKAERQKRKREKDFVNFDDPAPGTSGFHELFTRKGILCNKQPSASSKRLPPEVLESLSEQPPLKGMRKQDNGKSMKISEEERKNLEKKQRKLALKMAKQNAKEQDYISLESNSGATRFGVVPLRNLMASRNKLANEATSFRKEMLFGQRVKRTPISTFLAYEEKLKASSKDKF